MSNSDALRCSDQTEHVIIYFDFYLIAGVKILPFTFYLVTIYNSSQTLRSSSAIGSFITLDCCAIA